VSSPDIVTVVGARPQFVKAAVVARAFREIGVREAIVHTGQHYDDAMSGRFLVDLGLDNVAANLTVGSGSHSHQTARIMTGFQDYLDGLEQPPKAIVVYGDTNSTIGAGLVAAKVGIPLVHVEAGLRSYNRAMPEEINRVMTDHLSDLLFCSSAIGVANLAKEGLRANVIDVGDVMLDAFEVFGQHVKQRGGPEAIRELAGTPFVLATIHRPSNTDDSGRLGAILAAFGQLDMPVVWPVHPRNTQTLAALDTPANLKTIEPVGYLDMLWLLDHCRAVVTDSGGLQKEAYWARRPCVTMRAETEWVETLEGGWNVLSEPDRADFAALVGRTPEAPWRMLYGDGKASQHIAGAIAARFLPARNVAARTAS